MQIYVVCLLCLFKWFVSPGLTGDLQSPKAVNEETQNELWQELSRSIHKDFKLIKYGGTQYVAVNTDDLTDVHIRFLIRVIVAAGKQIKIVTDDGGLRDPHECEIIIESPERKKQKWTHSSNF